MARLWPRPSRRLVTFGVAAAFVVGTAPVAAAQLPGVNNNTQVFPIDDTRILIAVDEPDVESGTVGVTVQNNTDQALTCTGIEEGQQAGAVTTAEITAKSVEFYRQFPNSELSPIDIDIDPGPLSGSLADLAEGFEIDLGSVVGMVPGSAAGLVYPEQGALQDIGGDFTQARLRGQYGPMGETLTIPARTAEPFTVELGPTSRGDRPPFQAGVVLTCAFDGQRYVFHGYQGGEPPVTDTGSGSLSAGSLGS